MQISEILNVIGQTSTMLSPIISPLVIFFWALVQGETMRGVMYMLF